MKMSESMPEELGLGDSDENIGFNGAELSESVLGRDWNSPKEDTA